MMVAADHLLVAPVLLSLATAARAPLLELALAPVQP